MKLGMCIDIVEIWFGIADGRITSIFDELSARDTSVLSFPNDNFSKYQWIWTKRGVCIDIVKFAIGQISSNFDSDICPDTSIFSFLDNNLGKSQWVFTKLDMCIDIVEIWFGIANGQISSICDSYLPTT